MEIGIADAKDCKFNFNQMSTKYYGLETILTVNLILIKCQQNVMVGEQIPLGMDEDNFECICRRTRLENED